MLRHATRGSVGRSAIRTRTEGGTTNHEAFVYWPVDTKFLGFFVHASDESVYPGQAGGVYM